MVVFLCWSIPNVLQIRFRLRIYACPYVSGTVVRPKHITFISDEYNKNLPANINHHELIVVIRFCLYFIACFINA